MDLENLKSIWKEVAQQATQDAKVSSDQILSLLSGKTQSTLSKIKRSLFFEVGSLVLATVVFLALSIYHHLPSQMPLIVGLMALVALSGVYFYKKYLGLQKIENQGLPLKDALQQLINTLSRYLKIYFMGNIILTPISALVGFFYGYSLHSTDDTWLYEITWIDALVAGLFTLLCTALMYPFMKWYLQKLYGTYLDELKVCLAELEEDTDKL